MSVEHYIQFSAECPRAGGAGDSAVEDETQVTCLQCLRMIAVGMHVDDGDAIECPDHPYLLGYVEGKEAAYAEIVQYLEGQPHHRSCTCDPCAVVRGVWSKGLRMAQVMMGPAAWN